MTEEQSDFQALVKKKLTSHWHAHICLSLPLSPSVCLSPTVPQITVFRMGSEGHQDIDLAILTALLKGWYVHLCVCVCVQ